MLRHMFHAMGTEIDCLLDAESAPAANAALARVQDEFCRLEALLSRFLADSELSRLNRDGTVEASEDLLAVTELALEARDRTAGRFDPTVHDAVVSAGYDRTFARVPAEGGEWGGPCPCGGDVAVDLMHATVSLAPGTRVDFGGIAKGYAVDRTCELLADEGPCLVNAGGDLAVHGVPRQGQWPIGLEIADGSMTLGLAQGALATSGRDRRRWERSGVELHHLIDPSTGAPAESDLLRVTAIAGSAVEAEVLAKALFLVGEEEAVAEAERLGVPAVLVTADGRTVTVGLGVAA